jgi:hypothetical protein
MQSNPLQHLMPTCHGAKAAAAGSVLGAPTTAGDVLAGTLRLNDSDDEPRHRHGRQKQQVQAASRKAPPLNFLLVGRRTLRTLTNTAVTMLTDLICKETMP